MKDLIGMRFGRLTVIEFSHFYKAKNSGKKSMWRCKCDCGNEKVIRESSLISGDSKSCGCLLKERNSELHLKHNGVGTRLYAVWDSMRQRCNNPKNKHYCNYGGRGIKICEEWDDFVEFRSWALLNGYNENAKKGECTLERIDVNGNYSPDNCKWCNMKEQSNNKRNTIYIEYNNENRTLSEWADKTGIKYCTIWKRYSKGWPSEKILEKHN